VEAPVALVIGETGSPGGGGPAVADLAAGRVDAMIASPLEGAGQVQGGRERPLMVAGNQRIATWPEVPTAEEAGLAGFDNLWHDVPLRAERLKVHLDALAATISAGPPRSALY
jgi:tripartite-type tricarboxylate transporter receptor subunit TctC